MKIVKINPGEELRDKIEKFCAENNIKTAWINAIGSCEEAELAYYNLDKKEYETKIFSERLEIVTAMGNISLKDNKNFAHFHGTFSRANMEVIGGHINKCVISATCEVCIWPSEESMTRKYDDQTGLNLLCEP
jgi:predicted DNA-binding protein with PD1-like motif